MITPATAYDMPPLPSAGAAEVHAHALHTQRRTLRLTPRWTPLIPLEAQAAFTWHPARFKINPSGRRSGKTELVKRKAVLQLLKKTAGGPPMVFLAAPSFGQARDIFWEDIKALIPPWWLAKVSESRMEIRTKWGALLRVFGFDRPRRIEGVPWTWGAVDEIADCPPNCFSLNVRPALSTRGREGACDLTGVPDEVGRNQAEYEDLYHKGLNWPVGDPDICTFHWSSADVLDPKEIESARRTMDRLKFEQEYLGRFVSSSGKALPMFDVRFHVASGRRERWTEYCPSLPMDWTLDFGVGLNSASLLCQNYRGHVWVRSEIGLADGSTVAQGKAMPDHARRIGVPPHAARWRIFGDAAGHGRSPGVGRSDYDLLEEQLTLAKIRPEWLELRAPPPVKDTLNAVRSRVATADDVVHLHIHPSCERLINDCRKAPWPDRGNLKDFHFLAALRYYLYAEFGESGSGYETAPSQLPNLHPGQAGKN